MTKKKRENIRAILPSEEISFQSGDDSVQNSKEALNTPKTLVYCKQKKLLKVEFSKDFEETKCFLMKKEANFSIEGGINSRKHVHSAFEAQFSGNTRAIVDELEYMIDGLIPTNNIFVREEACLKLMQNIEDIQFLSIFKANGFIDVTLNHLMENYNGHGKLIKMIAYLLWRLTDLNNDITWLSDWITSRCDHNIIDLLSFVIKEHTNDVFIQAHENSYLKNDIHYSVRYLHPK
jgi:hypothetical protein